MNQYTNHKLLANKRGLIVGIANEQSIAWGSARIMHKLGAELAVTWLNDKARPHVEPLAERLQAPIRMPLDVENDEQMQAVFREIKNRWGRLDFVLHAVAFAPQEDLHGRVIDSSRAGFARAMDISCHSFVRMARLAEALMSSGGALLTLSYLGASEVIPNYGIMGPVKAALESSVRYLAAELGSARIRVNAVSPGAIATRAASGIASFDHLLDDASQRAPLHHDLDIADVGATCAFLVSDGGRAITGEIIQVDCGYHLLN